MSPVYYRDRIVRFWWLLLLCAVACGVGGWIAGALLFTVYSSSAMVQVDIRSSSPSPSSIVLADRLLRSSSQIAVSDSILSPVASTYGLSLTKLRGEVSAAPVANTLLMAVTVRDPNSARAAALANAIAKAVVIEQNRGIEQNNTQSQQPYIQAVQTLGASLNALNAQLVALGKPPSNAQKALSLEIEIDATENQYALAETTLGRIQQFEAAESNSIRVSSLARPSLTPVTSHQVATAVAGVAFGLALGAFLALAGEWLTLRVISAEAVARSYRWARLGGQRGKSDVSEQTSPAVLLARDLQFLGVEHPLRVVAFVSPRPTARTRTLVAQTAAWFARGGQNTLLIDAQLRDGAQAATFGVAQEPGLSDAILAFREPQAPASLVPLLQHPTLHADPHLLVLAAGAPPPNPRRLLASAATGRLLVTLAESPAEVILLDAPVELFAGTLATLQQALDAVVVVVDPARTQFRDLSRIARALSEFEGQPVGFVYTDAKSAPMPIATQNVTQSVDNAQHGPDAPAPEVQASSAPTSASV